MEESYLVPAGEGEAAFVEKRSRFIGRIWPCQTQQQAQEKIKLCRSRYWDATHNVYAYLIREENVMRYSDDGEPQGTAGMPVLEVLRREGVTNVCCVVTRYFGGILLGAGGLTRAYAHGAKIALDAVGVARMDRYAVLLIACPYTFFDLVQTILPRFDAAVEECEYGVDVTMTVSLPDGGEGALNQALRDATAGQVEGVRIESKMMARALK